MEPAARGGVEDDDARFYEGTSKPIGQGRGSRLGDSFNCVLLDRGGFDFYQRFVLDKR